MRQLSILFFTICLFVCVRSQGFLRSQNRFGTQEEILDPDIYCDLRRDENEFFRKKMPADSTPRDYSKECRFYYRCISAGFGKKEIVKSECAQTLYFDVEAQTCNRRREVLNCDSWEKNRIPRPRWPLHTDELSNCGEDEIECGSGECLHRSAFCDTYLNCTDGSDENICEHGLDPNPAPKCNPTLCKETAIEESFNGTSIYAHCHCSQDGTQIPANLPLEEVPQMILLTFNGAVTERSFQIYDDIFKGDLINSATGCTVKATFFATHLYSNYSAIQELHRRGHEIGVLSITNEANKTYWSSMDQFLYDAEYEGMRLFMEIFSYINDGSIVGMRVPNELSGGNEQFRMMKYRDFIYDASIVVPPGLNPVWPYTLDYAIPHACPSQTCPSKSFTRIWEVPINTLDRREDTLIDEKLTGCSYLDSCGITSPEYLIQVLDNNLRHHTSTNRAPLVLSFTPGYFDSKPELLDAFKQWIRDTAKNPIYNFLTIQQALKWMVDPKKISEIGSFEGWKGDKCEARGQPECSRPNSCAMSPRIREVRDEKVFLHTCAKCPSEYPWLYNVETIVDEYSK